MFKGFGYFEKKNPEKEGEREKNRDQEGGKREKRDRDHNSTHWDALHIVHSLQILFLEFPTVFWATKQTIMSSIWFCGWCWFADPILI